MGLINYIIIFWQVIIMHSLSNIYKAFYESNDSIDFSNFKDFLELYNSKNPRSEGTFDMSLLMTYKNDPAFVERQLLNIILKYNNIPVELEYMNLYIYKMSVESVSSEDANGILMDELFAYTMLSFYLTVFSLANDYGTQNFDRCFKNFIVTLDLQGRRKKIGVHDRLDFDEMLCMPYNVLNLACDAYWCTLSFIIGHELYHLTHKNIKPSLEDEEKADRFGYHILIHMIELQKDKQIPKDFQVFSENLYLSPIIFLEYFRLLEKFQQLCNGEDQRSSAFSPEHRKRLILELYYEDIPETFNTEEGNDLLNNCLDAIDMLEEQLIIKFNNGKLDFIINKH